MDIVLGVSVAPDAVRIVLVEGQGAGGVIVDQGDFDVPLARRPWRRQTGWSTPFSGLAKAPPRVAIGCCRPE